MAYSDYGAYVWRGDERRMDKEDAPLFASDEETFGADINDIPNAARIWAALIHAKERGKEIDWLTSIHHGILGDGPVRVLIHKGGLPEIWEMTDDGPHEITYHDNTVFSRYSFNPFSYEYKGYKFYFEAGNPYDGDPYMVTMTEPDGTVWEGDYGYNAE